MALTQMGFILRGDGLQPARDVTRLESPAFTCIIVGISCVDEAPAAAQRLVAEGAQLLELCGAFGPTATAAVIAAIGDAVPVGAVAYDNAALARLVAI
jgi:hypothetical protein